MRNKSYKSMILGAKYFIKDKIFNEVIEAQILAINDVEMSYRNLSNKVEFYRNLVDVDMLSIINEEYAKKLNNETVFSVKTDSIKAIISQNEIEKYSENNFKDLNIDKNTVLISISDPGTPFLNKKILNQFKNYLNIQFYDIEEAIGRLSTINDNDAFIIKQFILNNLKNNFVIHCKAGQSRSAAVGLAILMFGNPNFNLDNNPIMLHHRYSPNMFVFNKIIQ